MSDRPILFSITTGRPSQRGKRLRSADGLTWKQRNPDLSSSSWMARLGSFIVGRYALGASCQQPMDDGGRGNAQRTLIERPKRFPPDGQRCERKGCAFSSSQAHRLLACQTLLMTITLHQASGLRALMPLRPLCTDGLPTLSGWLSRFHEVSSLGAWISSPLTRS